MSKHKLSKEQLLKKVLALETQQAFDFLQSADADLNDINEVALLLSPSETRTLFLQERGLLDVVIEPKEKLDLSGTSIQNIKLLEPIGEGGMGAVYLATDTTLQRQVAVKALHNSHQISPKVQARFRREALILSQLDHPNICRIYNLIETDQADYLVLELIQGKTLKNTSVKQLSKNRQFEIALALLRALQAAHSKNIIHRDLKPENIMIDVQGEVKVLDFGISRLGEVSQSNETPSTEKNEITSQTVQGTVMGTLTYMSPEQAAGEELTTASDIYTLGLVFQEIFSQTPVYEEDLTADQLLKHSTAAETQTPMDLPHDLTQLIQRMKSKVPAERPTAVDAIQILEKIKSKPVRRMRYALVAALMLLAGLGVFKHINDLNHERKQANVARQQAEQVTEFLTSIFKVSNPYLQKPEDLKAIDLLDRGSVRIDTELKDQPQLKAYLQATIGDVYHVLGLMDQAENLLESAYSTITAVSNANPQTLSSVASMYGTLKMDQGKYEQAEALFMEAIEASGDQNTAEALAIKNYLALIYNRLNQFDKTNQITDEIIAVYQQNPEYDINILLNALNTAGMAKHISGDLTHAETNYQQALDIINSNQQKEIDFSTYVNLLGNLAMVYGSTDRADQSLNLRTQVVDLIEERMPANHPDLIGAYDNLAVDYYFLDDLEQAKYWNKKSLEVFENLTAQNKNLDDDFKYSYSMTLANYGVLLTRSSQYKEAEQVFIQVIENLTSVLGAEHTTVADYVQELAQVKLNLGENNLALELAGRAIDVYEKDSVPFASRELKAWIIKATVFHNRGQYAEAQAIELDMMSRIKAMDPPNEKLLTLANERFSALKSEQPKE